LSDRHPCCCIISQIANLAVDLARTALSSASQIASQQQQQEFSSSATSEDKQAEALQQQALQASSQQQQQQQQQQAPGSPNAPRFMQQGARARAGSRHASMPYYTTEDLAGPKYDHLFGFVPPKPAQTGPVAPTPDEVAQVFTTPIQTLAGESSGSKDSPPEVPIGLVGTPAGGMCKSVESRKWRDLICC